VLKEPWLLSDAEKPPIASRWLHEIKHNGFRVTVRHDPAGVRLTSRKEQQLVGELSANASRRAPGRSFSMDGKAGLPVAVTAYRCSIGYSSCTPAALFFSSPSQQAVLRAASQVIFHRCVCISLMLQAKSAAKARANIPPETHK
jgi:hypothetical protein